MGDMCEETCDEEEGDPAAFCAAGIWNLRLTVAGEWGLGGAIGILQVCGCHLVYVIWYMRYDLQ